MFGPLGLSLAPQVAKSRSLYRLFKPVSDWYAQISGYRQMGLKYDDLRESPRVPSPTYHLTLNNSSRGAGRRTKGVQ